MSSKDTQRKFLKVGCWPFLRIGLGGVVWLAFIVVTLSVADIEGTPLFGFLCILAAVPLVFYPVWLLKDEQYSDVEQMHPRKREFIDEARGLVNEYDVSQTVSFKHDYTAGWDLIVGSIFFSLGAIVFLGFPNHVADSDFQALEVIGISPYFAVIMMGVLCAVSGAFCVVSAASILVHGQGYSICFSPDGLSVEMGFLRIKNLPWDKISKTDITSIDGQNVYVALEVHDWQETLSKYGATVRFIAWLNVSINRAPLHLSAETAKDTDIYELSELIEAYRRTHGNSSRYV
jgi:hypothetical protein